MKSHVIRASDFLEEDLIEAIGIWFKALHSKPVKAFDFLPIETYIITRDQIVQGIASYESAREVIMFDFNFMTRGLASEEISLIRRNLRTASPDSEQRFMDSYGKYDQLAYALYEVYRHLTCLIAALAYDQVPAWAEASITYLEAGDLADQLHDCIQKLGGRSKIF